MTRRRTSAARKELNERRQERHRQLFSLGLQEQLARSTRHMQLIDGKYINIGFFGENLYVTCYDKEKKKEVIIDKWRFSIRD